MRLGKLADFGSLAKGDQFIQPGLDVFALFVTARHRASDIFTFIEKISSCSCRLVSGFVGQIIPPRRKHDNITTKTIVNSLSILSTRLELDVGDSSPHTDIRTVRT